MSEALEQAAAEEQVHPIGGWPEVPETARLPDGSTLYDGPPDGQCRVIKSTGERCRGSRVKRFGLCGGHAGITAIVRSPREMSSKGNEERRRRASVRATLGISARRAASPVQAARLAAQRRSEDFARAIVDGPLDDPDLSAERRQRAALAAVEVLFPEVRATVEVELPEHPDEVAGMGWAQLQQLAARYLGEG